MYLIASNTVTAKHCTVIGFRDKTPRCDGRTAHTTLTENEREVFFRKV